MLSHLLQTVCTLAGLALPIVLVKKLFCSPVKEVSNQMIFASHFRADSKHINKDELHFTTVAAWPEQLPGLPQIERYMRIKDKLVHEAGLDGDITRDARIVLRHALMDRCQAHVAWLLRFEREQRAIERMAKRGMMSDADYRKFSRFAECLDAEVNDVREEAGWLCEDPAGSRQASEEIWFVPWHLKCAQF